ncbi:MAG: hypothetical protein IRY97_08500 [Thermomicrobiaceae bacterium]|nr:hypothetical protein [Thermomicrobiaceae bacterium]
MLRDLVRVVNPTGRLGIVGVYLAKDPGGANEAAKRGEFVLPWGDIFNKGLPIGMGQTPVKRYDEFLRDLIIAGKAKPSFIVSQRLPLEAAPDAYQHFDRHDPGETEVVLKPQMPAAA